MLHISVLCRTNRFQTISEDQTMPGLIMSNIPSELTRRAGPNFSETQTNTSTHHHHHHPSSSSCTCQPFNGSAMTISPSTQPASSPSGPLLQHGGGGGASSALMSASSNGRVLRPVERLRLRDWLIRMIEMKAIPGLEWTDVERRIVKIPWKHAARHGYSRDKDACLFRAWAIHTKKYDPSSDSPKANPKVWKANFRCAINSLPDIEELREKGKSKGNDAYKVYRLHPKRSRKHTRDGSKPPKRPRSTSRPRSTKTDRKQRKKDLLRNVSESLSRVSDHSSTTKSSNPSINLAEDLLKKRMAEINAELPMQESTKRAHMSLDVGFRYILNPNRTTSTSITSPPSTLKSPTTQYTLTSSTTNGVHFSSPHAYTTSLPHRSTCVSPCTTTTNSTPATTPQSPPPPYQLAVRQRHGTGYINMRARFEMDPQTSLPGYDSYDGYVANEDYSDSDNSIMTEAEVAQMVLDIKEQSPGNSPRSLSPLDGNNNMDPALTHGEYWQHKQHEENVFFGNNFEANRQMATKCPMYQADYDSNLMGPHIKMEPDTYPSVMPQHQGVILNGYGHQGHLPGGSHSDDAYNRQSANLMYQQL